MDKKSKKVVNGKIISKKQLTDEHFQITFDCPYIANNIMPGQFIQIRISRRLTDPLLCRPFAVYKKKYNSIDVLFKIVGKGTHFLSQRNIGDDLEITGPLGNGFPLEGDFDTAMLIAGGMGIAGLFLLAEHLRHKNIIMLIGACSQDKIIGIDDLNEIGINTRIATDDGSCGYKGMVTDLLKNGITDKDDITKSKLFACGPMPMLKEVAQIAKQKNIPAYVSLEEKMACGIGACMGCACEVISSDGKIQYKMVCKDGPVFNAEEILWN
ncbi:MAG: dihydroorotate dehydrogenase electron transfer subunit [Candidatus Poribacteria bacterium]